MVYRDKIQITADILDVAKDGAKKTRIMYQANLSYKLVVTYLSQLTESGMLILENEIYILTNKGKKINQEICEYLEREKEFNQRLEKMQEEKEKLQEEKNTLLKKFGVKKKN